MYDILLGGQTAGRATVVREGLYYCFDCRCDLGGETIWRIQVRCGERTEDLGIPVPEGGRFVLRRRVPVKRLGEGEMTFRVIPRQTEFRGKFIPLSPEEPFRYLRRLEDAFLQIRDGQVGVILPD